MGAEICQTVRMSARGSVSKHERLLSECARNCEAIVGYLVWALGRSCLMTDARNCNKLDKQYVSQVVDHWKNICRYMNRFRLLLPPLCRSASTVHGEGLPVLIEGSSGRHRQKMLPNRANVHPLICSNYEMLSSEGATNCTKGGVIGFGIGWIVLDD